MSNPINAQTDPESGLRYYEWNGQKLMSATSVRRAIGTPLNLVNWMVNQTIDSVIRNPMLIEEANEAYEKAMSRRIKRRAGGVESDAEAAVRATKDARKPIRKAGMQERDDAADLGTSVHEAAEMQVASSRLPDTDIRKPFLMQYEDWMRVMKPKLLVAEGQCFNLTLGYAGSFDAIAMVNGEVTLIDYKTGKGVYTDHALQQALYFGSEFVGGYDPQDQKDVVYDEATSHLQNLTASAILHIRPDHWEWVPINITDELAAAAVDMVRLAHFFNSHPTLDTLK